MAGQIAAAVAAKASPDTVLALIAKHSKKTVADQLVAAEATATAVLGAAASAADVEATLTAALPLLKGVAVSVPTQLVLLFAVQGALVRLKAAKPVTLAAFTLLYDQKVVSPRALVDWKEDKKDKTAGKGPTLLAVNKLAMVAEEACKEPEPEEEEDEDEDDDLFANPNHE